MILSPKRILQLTEDRKQVLKGRDALYMLYRHYYFGDQDMKKIQTLAMNSQGRPLLRDIGEFQSNYKAYSSNRVPPIVDDYSAIIGRLPTSRVDPPDSSPQGEAKAELLTKYLISTHELSDMAAQQAEAGFYMSGLGDAVYLAEPEPELKRVVWETMDPQWCLPGFYGGYRRFKVYDVIVCNVWEASDINATFGDKVHVPFDAPPEDRTVIKYVSPYQRTILVGADYANGRTKVAVHAEWDLGFCPAVWARNKYTGAFGMSDIMHAINPQDFRDFVMNVMADGLIQNTYPLVVVKDPEQVGDLTLGPGATVPVTGQGDVQIRQTQGDIRAAVEMIQLAEADLNTSSGTTSMRQEGKMESDRITGKGAHAVQGPQSTRVDLKLQTMGNAIRLMNSYTLQMQEKAPHLGDQELEIHGRLKGKSFRETIRPKEDIDGWYRNTVAFDEMVGMNIIQKMQVAYEGMASGITDDIWGLEKMGVDDPLGMRERVGAMKIARAQQEQQAQAVMGGGQQQPGGGGTPPQAGPTAQPVGAPPNGKHPGNSAIQPMIAAPHQMPTPPPAPGKQGIGGSTKDEVKTALAPIRDKLKGEVWAVGNFALADSARVELGISDFEDRGLVVNAVKKVDPNAKVSTVPTGKRPPFAERLA